MSGTSARTTSVVPAAQGSNAVALVGRVTSAPELRELPSGDEVVVVGISVPRVGEGSDAIPLSFGPAPASGRRPRADQTGRRLLLRALRLPEGALVRVEGQLRRRWWATPTGRRSRIEVRVGVVELLSGGSEDAR